MCYFDITLISARLCHAGRYIARHRNYIDMMEFPFDVTSIIQYQIDIGQLHWQILMKKHHFDIVSIKATICWTDISADIKWYRVGWGKTPPLRVWWTSWSHTLLEHSIFLWHDSALLVEHTCQFQLLWVYTFLYDSSLNGAFPKGQLAPWVGQDAPLPRASRPLGGNLPHGRGRFAPSVI